MRLYTRSILLLNGHIVKLPVTNIYVYTHKLFLLLSSLVKEVSFYSGQWRMKRLNWLEVPRISKWLLSVQLSFPKFFFLLLCDHPSSSPVLQQHVCHPISTKVNHWSFLSQTPILNMVSPWFQAGLYSPLPQINVGLTYLWCHWVFQYLKNALSFFCNI